MDHPPVNAMGTKLMTWLRGELREAGGAPILLTGKGKAFSAGLDIAEVASLDLDGLRAFLGLLDDLVIDLYTYPGPVVALVNGHAIAGGCVLSLCSDFRVAPAGTKARIGLNEVALGLRFPPAVMALVRDRIPRRTLEEAILGAEVHDAENAARLGFIDEVADDAERVARERLALLESHSQSAYAATKRTIREPAMRTARAERHAWFEAQLPAWTSAEVRERLVARIAR